MIILWISVSSPCMFFTNRSGVGTETKEVCMRRRTMHNVWLFFLSLLVFLNCSAVILAITWIMLLDFNLLSCYITIAKELYKSLSLRLWNCLIIQFFRNKLFSGSSFYCFQQIIPANLSVILWHFYILTIMQLEFIFYFFNSLLCLNLVS